MTTPLSVFLTSFSASPPPLPLLVEPLAEVLADDDLGFDLPVDDMQERIDAAVDAARAEMASAHAAELGALADAQRVNGEAALAAARAAWAEGEGARLAGLMDERMDELRRVLEAGVAAVLRPLLSQIIIERTMHELSAALSKLLTDDNHPVLRITGPEDLLGMLRDTHVASGIDWVIDNAAEIGIEIAGTRIETQLGPALAAVTAVEH